MLTLRNQVRTLYWKSTGFIVPGISIIAIFSSVHTLEQVCLAMTGESSLGLRILRAVRELTEQEAILERAFPVGWTWGQASLGKTSFLCASLVSLVCADERGVTLVEGLCNTRLGALLSRMSSLPVPL